MRLNSIFLIGITLYLAASIVALAEGHDSVRDEDSLTPRIKVKVESLDDLPRMVYPIDRPPSEFLTSPEFSTLMAQVEKDVDRTLSRYDIQDASTLRRLYTVRSQIDFLNSRYESAIDWMEKRRALEDKEANRLTVGLTLKAWVAARDAAADTAAGEEFKFAFADALSNSIANLPWEIVQDNIEQGKGFAEVISNNFVLGMVESQIDPAVAKTGELTESMAWSLIDLRDTMDLWIPVKEEIVSVYSDLIAANRIIKPDIWSNRSIDIDPEMKAQPVVIGIWDTGVDTSIYQNSLWSNTNETFDNTDTDNNGFIDDVYGIAFDVEGRKSPELLLPAGQEVGQIGGTMTYLKGMIDVMSSVDSDEASTVKKHLGELRSDEVKSFMTDIQYAVGYTHGTHVAGIAIEGNPFARILVARITFDHQIPPLLLTTEIARRHSESYRDTVDYFKAAGIRAVNMSWGWTLKEVEGNLEANGITNPEERKVRTREIFGLLKEGLQQAIASAPDILFVAAAGNSDADVNFDEWIPQSIDLPNLLVVGAVDQAGDPANFTNTGENVSIYSNGFEVDSFVPGGQRMKFSGTSMSAPNVINLAAKLYVLDPRLGPSDIIELITKGATPRDDDESMLLIHPKASVELLQSRL